MQGQGSNFDEMFDGEGNTRPAYAEYCRWYGEQPGELMRRKTSAPALTCELIVLGVGDPNVFRHCKTMLIPPGDTLPKVFPGIGAIFTYELAVPHIFRQS